MRQFKTEEWNEILRKVKIKPGDFFCVPSGTFTSYTKGTGDHSNLDEIARKKVNQNNKKDPSCK